MRLTLILSALFLFNCTSRQPPEWQGPPIVRMKCPGVKSVAIIPTMHNYSGPIPPSVIGEMHKADVIFVEFDFRRETELQNLIKEGVPDAARFAPIPPDYLGSLDATDRKTIEGLIGKSNSFEKLRKSPPLESLLFVLLLAREATRGKGEQPTQPQGSQFDVQIAKVAVEKKIEVVGLEDPEFVVEKDRRRRDKIASNSVQALKETLKVVRSPGERTDMQAWYRSATLGDFDEKRSPQSWLDDLDDREQHWVKILKSKMLGKRVAIAVGASHVSPSLGLPPKLVANADCQLHR